jgi:hypothetical protein
MMIAFNMIDEDRRVVTAIVLCVWTESNCRNRRMCWDYSIFVNKPRTRPIQSQINLLEGKTTVELTALLYTCVALRARGPLPYTHRVSVYIASLSIEMRRPWTILLIVGLW